MLGPAVKSYQVWGRLSQGGMSEVWLARHAELALPVVIKTLKHTAGETFEGRYARLLSEARMAARLTSPRVVRVMDVGMHRDPDDPAAEPLPYLVEEYVDGIDLADFDRRRRQVMRRPLPLWAVADYTAQAAEGLHAAHQAGVIHRDVKPSNLFGWGHGWIKVGDFGIAVTASADDAPLAGTLLFMAPEQVVGGRIDRRADIYSLGATAYALRYGRAPYDSLEESLRATHGPRFPPPRTPEEAFFQNVVARMLEQRPDRRYPHLMVTRQQFHALASLTAPRLTTVRLGESEFALGDTRITFEVGDASLARTDGVVNSANTRMQMRGGVGDALRRRGGDGIEEEAMRGGERALGECLLTGPGRLPVRGILHAVGAWNEVSCIARSTHHALLTAEEQGYRSLTFPAVGTGQGRVSLEACADAMVGALRQHLVLGGSRLGLVRFVLYDADAYARVLDVAAGILVGSDDARLAEEIAEWAETGPASHATTLQRFGSPSPPVERTPTERFSEDELVED